MNIHDVLANLANGMAAERVDEQLAQVVAAVQDTGKPGKITLAITIKRTGSNAITAKPKVTSSCPEHDMGNTTFFVDAQHNLSREDPRQHKLALRDLEGEAVEIRTVT